MFVLCVYIELYGGGKMYRLFPKLNSYVIHFWRVSLWRFGNESSVNSWKFWSIIIHVVDTFVTLMSSVSEKLVIVFLSKISLWPYSDKK